ncbi:MAG: right-handed parallel beta-helix repeat-containing protein [Bacteroidales bacterium]|nr:right-handed parallel beta-helix repeat-containing protein [Bacteroidales bacterium]
MQKKLLFLIVLFLVAIQYMNAQTHFGTGNDGALTVASGNVFITDQAKSPIVGDFSTGSNSIAVGDGSVFQQGDEVIIITMVDPETNTSVNLVGQYETHYIHAVAQNQLVLEDALLHNFFSTGGQLHQVVKIPNYTDVTVNGEMTCSNWDGSTGGVLFFRATGSVTISTTGKINVDGKGYRGHNRQSDNQHGYQGEGLFGLGVQSMSANGNAGGGGQHAYGGGGGGGYAFAGGDGTNTNPGLGGQTLGDSLLTSVFMGGAGGTGGDNDSNAATNPNSGSGGGILIIAAYQLTNFGILSSNGLTGQASGGSNDGGAGGGAGGSIFIQAIGFQNDSNIVANGGTGFNSPSGGDGGNGSVGRIRIITKNYTNTGNVVPLALENNLFGIIHLPLTNQPDITGTYDVAALIIDEQGNTITSASVFYRVNTGSWVTLAMTAGGGYSFSAGIPAQSIGAAVDYYISGTDGSDVYYSPLDAPTGYYSFLVNGYPPSSFSVTDMYNGSVELNWNAPTTLGSLVNYKVYRHSATNFTPGPTYEIATVASDTFYVDNTVSDFYHYYYVVGANYGLNVATSHEEHILVNDANYTTVLGYAYLEGQSNHANIKIKFHPISPSAVLDSTYTNALGYFETTVVPGIYDVTYEKVTFQTYTRATNLSIIDDYNFGESTIMMMGTTVSGNATGVWDGLYTVSGNITVPNGDTLIINAGSEIRFLGNYNIYVYGYLLVDGAEGDSVLFTSAPYNQVWATGQWQGIDFYDASDNTSAVNYAIIRYAVDGIYIDEANTSVNHCKIYYCSDKGIQLNGSTVYNEINNTEIFWCYDGIYSYYARPTITYMNSHHNSNHGLYWDYYSYGSISNSAFSNNSSRGMYIYRYSSPGVYDTEVTNNSSWGIDIRYISSPTIQGCQVSDNTGYGISTDYDGHGWHSTDIVDCIIEDNTSWGLFLRHYHTAASEIKGNLIQNNGGGMYLYYEIDARIYNNRILNNNSIGIYFDNNHYCDPYIHHNVIAYNNGDGIHRDDHYSSAIISYNTIFGNIGDGIEVNQTSGAFTITNNIIANNNEYGLRSNKVVGVFEYNDIYSNGTGEVSNTANLPVNSWNFVSYNAQNDSADIYLNISEDPLFLFAVDSLDLQLSAPSPCINTGDPAILDPDKTTSDLGALYFDQGYPHNIYVDGYSNQTISLRWDSIEIDSLLSYNVYYKLNSASTYTMFGNAAGLSTDVTGLTNDSLYNFTVAGVYGFSVSGYAPKVSAIPGVPGIGFDPEAFNLTITTDTLNENLLVTNNGSKELHIEFPQGSDNKCTHFDGGDDFYYASDPAHLEGMTAMTMELWVYRQANGHMEFFGKHYRQYSMYINSNNMFGTYKGFTSDFYENYTANWVVPANEWHHLAITWEGTDMWFYADGNLVDHNDNVMPNAIPNLTYYFTIGARANDWSYDFNGYLSEARIWNYARSQEEIQKHMYSPLTGSEPGLLGYWPLKNDHNDHSIYGIGFNVSGNMYLTTTSGIAYDIIPYILPNGESYDIAASATLSIPFDFINSGQTGTYLYTQHIYSNILGNQDIEYEMALTFGQTVPSTPVHFTPVTPTGIPYTIIITNAMVDGATIAVGDEIGVYDGSLCVGAGIFDGNFNFVITVWEDEPAAGITGFLSGNIMSFIIYDTSADLEAPSDATYTVGDGTFGFKTFSALSLNGTVYKIQEVPITGGMFNLISFNLLPHYSAATTVFGDLSDLQIAYNDAGNALIPPYNINTIGDIYFKDGYHVYTNSNDTVFFEGTPIDPAEWPILVEVNKWNSIAYLGDVMSPVVSAILPSIVDSISIIQASNGNAWIPSLNINTLGNFMPAMGYQIALSSQSNINLVYQVVNGTNKVDLPVQPQPQYFKFAKTGLPYQIVADVTEVNGQQPQPGDEIAVFDNDACVGAAVITGSSRILITGWEGDSRTKLSGFEKGHEMSFRLYSAQFGELACASKGLNNNDNEHFKAANFAHVEIEPVQDVQTGFSCYPNPFAETTNISIYLEEESDVTLRVTDLSGREIDVILQKTLTAGSHTFNWNGSDSGGNKISTGVYFIEFNNGTERTTEKLIRIK